VPAELGFDAGELVRAVAEALGVGFQVGHGRPGGRGASVPRAGDRAGARPVGWSRCDGRPARPSGIKMLPGGSRRVPPTSIRGGLDGEPWGGRGAKIGRVRWTPKRLKRVSKAEKLHKEPSRFEGRLVTREQRTV
jgi:hypothetical protein